MHVEPFEIELRVKYRIDGVLVSQPQPPKHLQAALIGRGEFHQLAGERVDLVVLHGGDLGHLPGQLLPHARDALGELAAQVLGGGLRLGAAAVELLAQGGCGAAVILATAQRGDADDAGGESHE